MLAAAADMPLDMAVELWETHFDDWALHLLVAIKGSACGHNLASVTCQVLGQLP